jgi:hypothetical protein
LIALLTSSKTNYYLIDSFIKYSFIVVEIPFTNRLLFKKAPYPLLLKKQPYQCFIKNIYSENVSLYWAGEIPTSENCLFCCLQEFYPFDIDNFSIKKDHKEMINKFKTGRSIKPAKK